MARHQINEAQRVDPKEFCRMKLSGGLSEAHFNTVMYTKVQSWQIEEHLLDTHAPSQLLKSKELCGLSQHQCVGLMFHHGCVGS
jgi:hypothetical protein